MFFFRNRFFGGFFPIAGSGTSAQNLATWNGTNFGIVGDSNCNGVNWYLNAMAMNGFPHFFVFKPELVFNLERIFFSHKKEHQCFTLEVSLIKPVVLLPITLQCGMERLGITSEQILPSTEFLVGYLVLQ